MYLQLDGERLPDGAHGHVDDGAGVAVDARGGGGAGGVASPQRSQRADRVRAAVLGERSRYYL